MLTSTLPQLREIENNSFWEEFNHVKWKAKVSLISYGVCIGIRVNEPISLARLWEYLPPGWELSSSPHVDQLYSLIVSGSSYQLYREQEKIADTTELEDILETLDSDLRIQIGIAVKDRLFVHAGVVGWQGEAIVIPGRSFSGKTTLVAALVKAGGTYYSDEYAVLDSDGLVHPYPRRLSLRQGEGERVKRLSVEELGGYSGTKPLPVGLIIHTQYQLGTQWNPNPISPGQAVLALLDNTIVARLRPEFALPILIRAASGALTLEGERGEAETTAVAILKQLED